MKVQNNYLTVNAYSRPGKKMGTITGIVVHWVANSMSAAIANRNYFESLKAGKKNDNGSIIYASSHYIVGLEGEVIACVPETEVAYHASSANSHYLGIEVCHKDWEGQFTSPTYDTLLELIADICRRYKLNPLTDVIRHYDVTSKNCPKYYVEHQDAWVQLKKEANKLLQKEEIEETIIQLNGKEKKVATINKEGTNFIKLRDLADEHIDIGYHKEKKMPVVTIK